MDCSLIYKELYRYYSNYEYKLSNSYIYNWESDFFGMSKAGYFLEVEVKVSRNDYFRDFIKEKHGLFKDVAAAKSHHIARRPSRGDEICRYVYGVLEGSADSSRIIRRNDWMATRYNGKRGYWVNDNSRVSIRKLEERVYAPATMIEFNEIDKILCPNQLYFACPDGLIKPEEVPGYAGLLYYNNVIELIKKAPYLHKRKQDMNKILLSKFYNLWQYKTTIDSKITMSQDIIQ